MTDERNFNCSFCAKDSDSVKMLIAGPAVFICDECVTVCDQIIARHAEEHAPTNEDR